MCSTQPVLIIINATKLMYILLYAVLHHIVKLHEGHTSHNPIKQLSACKQRTGFHNFWTNNHAVIVEHRSDGFRDSADVPQETSTSWLKAPCNQLCSLHVCHGLDQFAIEEASHICSWTCLALSHTKFDPQQMWPGLCHTGADQYRGNNDSCAAWMTLQCQLAVLDPRPASSHMV